MAEEMKTIDLQDVEIFEVGTWHGDQYTEKDLDDIVNSFSEIGGKLKPYLKLGHSQDQKLLQSDGYPSAGWITNLKRNGKKLMADINAIPEKIAMLIKSKGYGRISSEIFWNLKLLGKTYPRALKAVALLGGNTPEVVELNDFINLYTEGFNYDKVILYTNKENDMDEQVLKQYMSENETLKSKVTELEKENEKIVEFEKKLSDKDNDIKSRDEKIAEFEKEKVEMFNKEVTSTIELWAKDGKVTPAQKEQIIKVCDSPERFESMKMFMENQGKVVLMGESATHVETNTGESEDIKFDNEVKKYAKENKVSYTDAFRAVAQEKGGK